MNKKEQSAGRQAIGSWLGGASSINPNLGYQGERLGLPQSGPGSVASMARRLSALLIDWIASMLVALLFTRTWGGAIALGVFYTEVLVFTSLLGASAGQRLLRIRVARASDGGPAPILAVIIRSLLLFLVVPAAIYDRDGRGLHDRAAGTVVVRAG
ncbi:MAG TPA: RDD family protein [Candidatus Nanopelagicaceae bacterium]|nr:RDD family protein [Candidatus Nanopelagicaceae bacterium]